MDKGFLVSDLCFFLDDSFDGSRLGIFCHNERSNYKCIIPDPKRREELHKNLLMLDPCPFPRQNQYELPGQIRVFFRTEEPFGSGEPANNGALGEWEISNGDVRDIRAIGIKCRLWDNRTVVQGFKIELSDGTQKAVGMELNDTLNVTSFTVDPDDHIVTPFGLRSDQYRKC